MSNIFKHTSTTVILTSNEPEVVPLGYVVIVLITCSSWDVRRLTVQFGYEVFQLKV